MTTYKQQLGQKGEQLAAEYLVRQGMEILERNYHIHGGEADIIAKDGETYVFVEVKSRTNLRYGRGVDAVDAKKQAALMAPTEILAFQHYKNLKKLFEPFGFETVLLTGGLPVKERRQALEKIKSGSAQIIVGTHALISEVNLIINRSLCLVFFFLLPSIGLAPTILD